MLDVWFWVEEVCWGFVVLEVGFWGWDYEVCVYGVGVWVGVGFLLLFGSLVCGYFFWVLVRNVIFFFLYLLWFWFEIFFIIIDLLFMYLWFFFLFFNFERFMLCLDD